MWQNNLNLEPSTICAVLVEYLEVLHQHELHTEIYEVESDFFYSTKKLTNHLQFLAKVIALKREAGKALAANWYVQILNFRSSSCTSR